jgi:hypothetical protein
VNCERAQVDTGDSVIKENSLDQALSALQPDDEILSAAVAIFTGRNDEMVVIQWDRAGGSQVEVAGAQQIWVLGMARSVDRFVSRGATGQQELRRDRRRLRRLPYGITTQALGMVVGTGLLALIALMIRLV